MTLQDVIDQLNSSELSNLYQMDDDTGYIDVERVGKLIPQVNLGVRLLHQRFFIRENTTVVNREAGKTRYTLGNLPIMRIERVVDLDDNEYLLDVEDAPDSIMRLSNEGLLIPDEIDEKVTTFTVYYKEAPSKIHMDERFEFPENVTVDLPEHFMEPLVYFIASRAMNPMGASEGLHEGNNYAAKYEQACRLLEAQNYDLDRRSGYDNFRAAGWV